MTALLRTPLFKEHKKLGAQFIDFGGWELPVRFSSIKEEHEAVRKNAGLFDVSHMGEIEVTGKDSLQFLQYVMTNDVSLLVDGKVQYSAMCYEDGGTVDDLLIYRKGPDNYLLVVNAMNIRKDYQWLTSHLFGDVRLEDTSRRIALLAIQGPKGLEIVQQLADVNITVIKPFTFRDNIQLADHSVLLSRTGYTGEDGFEIYCAWDDAPDIWNKLLEFGKDEGLLPCGLGARDTLRFESALPLYGQELSRDITPIEAGMSFAVKMNKDSEFLGKDALRKENVNNRKLVGIEMKERGIPRHGYKVFADEKQIGVVTTGTQVPTTKRNVGLALVDKDYCMLRTEVEVHIRNKKVLAEVVEIPFYQI